MLLKSLANRQLPACLGDAAWVPAAVATPLFCHRAISGCFVTSLSWSAPEVATPCCPCSPGRDKEQRSERRVGESAVWAGLGVSVIALRTDEKVFVVKEASGEKESAAACSEREREPRHSGQTCPRGADVGAGACGGGCAASAGVCEGWPRGAGRLLWTAQLLYTLSSPPGCSGCVLFSAQVY